MAACTVFLCRSLKWSSHLSTLCLHHSSITHTLLTQTPTCPVTSHQYSRLNPHNDDTQSPSSSIYSVDTPSPAIVSPPSTLDSCSILFVSLLPSFFSPFSCEGRKVHLETLIHWSNLLPFFLKENSTK